MKKLLIVCLSLALFPSFSQQSKLANYSADHNTPAISWGKGGVYDRSFNELSYRGAERFTKKTGIQYDSLKGHDTNEYFKNLSKFAMRGADPIIAIGRAQTAAVKKAAAKFPDSHFIIVSGVVDAPNVTSIAFKTEESSFLVGMLAAIQSKTGKLGFIGGTFESAGVKRFLCGYEQGVQYVNPEATIIENSVGSYSSSIDVWASPKKGEELANKQIKQGADVIFAVAGGTGKGVYLAAKRAGVYAIGVDSNQNYMQPGTMLTSAVKNLDVVVEKALGESGKNFSPGVKFLGLSEDAVGWALDEYNEDVVSSEMKAKVEDARKKIIAGKITVQAKCTDQNNGHAHPAKPKLGATKPNAATPTPIGG